MNDLKLFWGFDDRQTDGQTDICTSRVAFATENNLKSLKYVNIICLTVVKVNIDTDVY